ncbi:uncharacterized protein LOC108231233 [Kryptolebias marmoratus]|uniref:uncharacterized protein LOC108231233 n=1 Tax=Kryptolebias marmoratus TaxID=37003 RepID=UPI0007F8E56C|nr:uncharacterized protein LOC108231233 [Kryptolebias marmoratus]
MIFLWVTLLLFHQGYTLVPVTTVQLGEPVTFTCPVPEDKDSSFLLCWYKQNAGDSMKLIASLLMHVQPEYGPEFSASRINVMLDKEISNLTILRTVQGDEGMYHCAFNDWKNHSWHGNYLSLKGNSDGTSNYTVVEQRTSSDPDRPGGSVSLQCSVLSDSDNKTCSGGLSVFWFRSRSDKSYPDIIYADGNRHDECEKKPDSQKRCVFSKNIISSDAESYYCAVATCGQILFGKGIKIEAGSSLWTQHERTVVFLLSAVLALSLIVIAVLMCSINKNKCLHCKAVDKLQIQNGGPKSQQTGEHEWIYSAAVFTRMKSNSRAMKDSAEKQRIYAAVKAFGLN